MIHDFIDSRLDYCDVLGVGLDQPAVSSEYCCSSTYRKEKKGPYYTCAALLWLPARLRTDLKVNNNTFKSILSTDRLHLLDLLNARTPARDPWSADQLLPDVTRIRLQSNGKRAFAVAPRKIWNSLPL